MAKNNMGVADQEFVSAANAIDTYAGKLDTMIGNYSAALKIVCERAIQDQQISAKLAALATQAEALRSPLREIAEKARKDCKGFVDAIDEADQFLY